MDLPVGGSVTYVATGAVAAGASGVVSNRASATNPVGTSDPQPADNSATVVTVVDPGFLFADGFESGDTSGWTSSVGE